MVASLIHKGPTVSYRYTTLVDATTKALQDKAQPVDDSERIRQLEKEQAQLREECDILRKAATHFDY